MRSTRSRAIVLLGATLLAGACAPSPSPTASPSPVEGETRPPVDDGAVLPVRVEGTAIVVHAADGTRVSRDDLIGSVLAVSVDGGPPRQVRIDAIEPDPKDATGDVLLYALSAEDASGARHDVCPPDPSGLRRGFPLAGAWTSTGEHVRDPATIELTCTSGADSK